MRSVHGPCRAVSVPRRSPCVALSVSRAPGAWRRVVYRPPSLFSSSCAHASLPRSDVTRSAAHRTSAQHSAVQRTAHCVSQRSAHSEAQYTFCSAVHVVAQRSVHRTAHPTLHSRRRSAAQRTLHSRHHPKSQHIAHTPRRNIQRSATPRSTAQPAVYSAVQPASYSAPCKSTHRCLAQLTAQYTAHAAHASRTWIRLLYTLPPLHSCLAPAVTRSLPSCVVSGAAACPAPRLP